MRKSIIIGFGLLCFAKVANAQVGASSDAGVTIISPLTINPDEDLNFGLIAPSGSSGTVQLTPTGSRNAGGGITLPSTSNSFTPAKFTVTGEAGYTYEITLPTAPISLVYGNNNMTVDGFQSYPATVGILSTTNPGSQVLKVGATLFVSANQTPGLYASSIPFDVTVNYN